MSRQQRGPPARSSAEPPPAATGRSNGSPARFAAAAIKTKRRFKVKFDNLGPRLGCEKALVAIAHKIIKVMWHVITKMEPYRDNAVDLEAHLVQRMDPRWIKQMAKHNLLDRAILGAKSKPPAKAKPPINSKQTGEVMMTA
jgi:hypothetical protein